MAPFRVFAQKTSDLVIPTKVTKNLSEIVKRKADTKLNSVAEKNLRKSVTPTIAVATTVETITADVSFVRTAKTPTD